jgi:hypothetical protein
MNLQIGGHGDYLLHPESAGGGEDRRARRREKKGDDDASHGGAEPRHRRRGAGDGAATAMDPTNRLSLDPDTLLPEAPPPATQKPRPQGGAVFARPPRERERVVVVRPRLRGAASGGRRGRALSGGGMRLLGRRGRRSGGGGGRAGTAGGREWRPGVLGVWEGERRKGNEGLSGEKR